MMQHFEIVPDLIAIGRSGDGKTIDRVDGDILHSGDVKLHRSGVARVIQPSPRKAIVHQPGCIEVDLDRLALSYQPTVTTPSWIPSANVKPYEELTKLYLDIETTGLNPEIDRVLMVGVIALGLRDDRRLELSVTEIRQCWDAGDLATIQAYLEFDLEDTRSLADFLLGMRIK
jgi:uncharacterized protein YprB with RNaseH-like and TPR domain